MWSSEQRNRLVLEHQVLQSEGFTQFGVYHQASDDTYYASGITYSNARNRYGLHVSIPNGYPYARPPMYVTEPLPLYTSEGTRVASLGVSHQMHTLTPSSSGMVQICHWRDDRWHSGILLHKVFLKGPLWIEAYEQHLATGRALADFVRTMAEAK